MRRLLLALALCAVPLGAAARDLAAEAAAVRDRALDDKTAWELVESLTTEIGPRPVGSPAMQRARDWGVAKLEALGFRNVHVERFTTVAWTRGPEKAAVVSPWPQPLHILGLGRSAPTPKGGLTAPIALFQTYQEMLDQPAGALKGKIAVVVQGMPRTQGEGSYSSVLAMRTDGPVEAARRGAVAYLIRSLSTDDTRLPHAGNAKPGGIPAAALSPPDAALLARMAARGQPVILRLEMASSFREEAEAWNVSGEIPGREAPDEVIVVGGHLDSWDPGTGAVDDGAGVAITTAAAKLAASLNPPRRTIRVVMWGAEEQGGSGAAYAKAHAAETGRIVLVGESDAGADRIWRVQLPRGSAGEGPMQAFRAAMAPLNLVFDARPPEFGGSDVAGLIKAGAPFVHFSQDVSRYFDLHHSADDTLDKIEPAALAQNVAVWAAFLHTVANSALDFRALAASADRPQP